MVLVYRGFKQEQGQGLMLNHPVISGGKSLGGAELRLFLTEQRLHLADALWRGPNRGVVEDSIDLLNELGATKGGSKLRVKGNVLPERREDVPRNVLDLSALLDQVTNADLLDCLEFRGLSVLKHVVQEHWERILVERELVVRELFWGDASGVRAKNESLETQYVRSMDHRWEADVQL